MNKVFLLKREDLAPGEVRQVQTDGCPLAVYNLEGRFYATSDVCTHATASLSSGEIVDGDLIACPVHDGQFHIPTGQAVTFPCTVDLRTYRIIEDGDQVFADLDAESEDAVSSV
ncbi:non-heme iron oxygenase ferredoxin subunit [Burkholderia multivorans]|uniref:non-heme iron oxygenase ferredoxin subunit n=1 Tax=Burkholderia multivorans TaxID=87883 RepID=UPI002019292C|nr:non-heme iron oxygenase ferredoxin subunit [Burkholderia multivorans]MCO1367053.1 non-heme iron oxygenase ferredoxin subunit [Burkholderia multivorans]MCO1376662.1 non-heme iron oxygenase ferredoxin subunit [Burkholderia multivorans]UQP18614.1 non-heme iron oxygenase ferredoxin subunit [Burkholderia multivorans]UQP86583.1 non-heme iron oxygenase ferredoxin subunit [Burkholderia multivorans]